MRLHLAPDGAEAACGRSGEHCKHFALPQLNQLHTQVQYHRRDAVKLVYVAIRGQP